MNRYCLLHNVGPKKYKNHVINSNYNSCDQIERFQGVLTFDGIYRNVLENEHILKGREVIFFVMGDYIGKDNRFDKGMPYEKYCTWDELLYLKEKYNIKFGWHTWSHRDLTILPESEIIKECTPSFETDLFAYPYGRFDNRVINILQKLDYKKAFSVNVGNNSDFQILRPYLHWGKRWTI